MFADVSEQDFGLRPAAHATMLRGNLHERAQNLVRAPDAKSRERSCGASSLMSALANTMRPQSRARSPVIRLNRVDLPAPFGPITASASPASTDRVRLFVA